MESKAEEEEKKLLKQITYLSRLIEKKNSACSTLPASRNKLAAKDHLRNSRYTYHASNKPPDSVNVQNKTFHSISSSSSAKPNSSENILLPFNSEVKIPKVFRATQNESSCSNLVGKKYVYVNCKRLLDKDHKPKEVEEPFNTKRNVFVNPKGNLNIYVNSAKLLIANPSSKECKTVSLDKLPSTKQSIYVNPKYNGKWNSNSCNVPPNKDSTPTVSNATSDSDIRSCSNIGHNNDASAKVHVNKDFIARNTSKVNDLSLKLCRGLNGNEGSLIEVNGGVLKCCESNVVPQNCKSKQIDEVNKKLTLEKDIAVSVKDYTHSLNTCKTSNECVKLSTSPTQAEAMLLSVVKKSITPNIKSVSNSKINNSTLKRNKLLKLVKLNRMKLVRKEVELSSDKTAANSNLKSYRLQKQRLQSKMVPLKRLQTNKTFSNVVCNNQRFTFVRSATLKKPAASCTAKDGFKHLKPTLKSSKPVSVEAASVVRSSLSNKPTELIKLSNTKLIRKRSRSSLSSDKGLSQTRRQEVQLGLSSAKKFKNDRVSINSTANSKTMLNNGFRQRNFANSNNSSSSNSSNTRYKYNSNNSTTLKISENKLSLVKVNSCSPVKKSITLKSANKVHNNIISVCPKTGSVQKCRVSPRKSSECLISISPTKLVRGKTGRIMPAAKSSQKVGFQLNLSLKRNNALVTPIKLVTTRVSSITRTARSVKTKYKLIRNTNKSRPKASWNRIYVANTSSSDGSLRNKVNNRVLFNVRQRLRKKSITINGVKYHTTGTKLRRNFQTKEIDSGVNIFKNKGDSYRVSSGGRSLKRIYPAITLQSQSANRPKARNRLRNIDCKLFQKSHFAWYKVSQAKQRSIALLTRKLHKSNEPCLIFHRFGKCSGKERGTCYKLHDKKNVSICKRFLKGTCENANCLLSHDVGPSKMPTCKHYLAGICIRDNCPYLHVKLNSSAPICVQFLQGYCPNADKCKKRHVDVCPEFEEKGSCSKGKSCFYPHPKCRKWKQKKVSNVANPSSTCTVKRDNIYEKEIVRKDVKRPQEEKVSSIEVDCVPNRYYNALDSVDSDTLSLKRDTTDSEDIVGLKGWVGNRPRLGSLPAFIPLTSDEHL